MSASTRVFNPLVMFLYRISGGRIAGRMGKAPIMILTTKGSRSGKLRSSPVLYMVDGEDVVTVASAGGAEKNPSWFMNLMRDPDASVTIKRETRRVRARRASAKERERLWPLLTSMFPRYAIYAQNTKREIPIVILAPVR